MARFQTALLLVSPLLVTGQASTCLDIKTAYQSSSCCNTNLAATTAYTLGAAHSKPMGTYDGLFSAPAGGVPAGSPFLLGLPIGAFVATLFRISIDANLMYNFTVYNSFGGVNQTAPVVTNGQLIQHGNRLYATSASPPIPLCHDYTSTDRIAITKMALTFDYHASLDFLSIPIMPVIYCADYTNANNGATISGQQEFAPIFMSNQFLLNGVDPIMRPLSYGTINSFPKWW